MGRSCASCKSKWELTQGLPEKFVPLCLSLSRELGASLDGRLLNKYEKYLMIS